MEAALIVAKIELWPYGNANRARDLGVVEIANTGGDINHGDYDVRLQKSPEYSRRPGIWKKGAVKGFPRRRLGPYDLLLRALANVIGDRNPEAHHFAFTTLRELDRSSAPDGHSAAIAIEVLGERTRQMSQEGWTLAHDDSHTDGEMALAAACYASEVHPDPDVPPADWPWDDEWWKPKDRRRNLVRAAALLVAEIERLDRAEAKRIAA